IAERHVVVSFTAAQPPAWARPRISGPLFADELPAWGPASSLLDEALDRPPPPDAAGIRWDWHLQARDFTPGPHQQRLERVVQRVLEDRPIALVMDRPRRPVALAEGMDRRRPAVLQEIGLDLAAFLRLPEIAGDADAF